MFRRRMTTSSVDAGERSTLSSIPRIGLCGDIALGLCNTKRHLNKPSLITLHDIPDEVFSIWLWDVLERPDQTLVYHANSGEAKLQKMNPKFVSNNAEHSELCCKTCSLGTPSPPLNTSPGPAYLSELLHVYTLSRTLRSSSNTRMLEIQLNTNARLMAFAPSLALDPTFGIHSTRP